MPELKKPDMPAVLQRTNLARHFGGFLLPVFEATSNSIHAIGEKYGYNNISNKGRIHIKVRDAKTRSKFSLEIADNGPGLDTNNFESFLTPFTGNKLRKNGKGFGRFIAFKVFETIKYAYKDKGDKVGIAFKFDIYADEELTYISSIPEFKFKTGCIVKYEGIKAEYEPQFLNLNRKNFLDAITQNFLTQLSSGRMPVTIVDYDGEETDLRDHFLQVFQHQETHRFSVELNGVIEQFAINVARTDRGGAFDAHTLLFFADERILGQGRKIEAKMGRPFFERADGTEYLVIGTITGNFLDENANNDRTFLEASEDEIRLIVDAACEAILKTEIIQHEDIKTEQRNDVVGLLQRHPLLRFGLEGQTVEQYVAAKPNGWRVDRFVSDLAVQRHRAERRWDKLLDSTFQNDEQFQERKDDLLSRVTEIYRNALAEYVVHRKAVLDLADRLRKFNADTEMEPEDAFHHLVFPRNSDSIEKSYYQHNLWILDERLAFTSYVSSDRTLHGGRRKQGDSVPDLNFYDELYVAGGAGTTSVLLVEFKRPGRDDYSIGRKGCDPIRQMMQTVAKIRERKSFVTTSGQTITIPDSHQITSYIVADLEPSLRKLAKDYDYTLSWDEKSLFHYHKEYKMYTEIYGFDKLIEDAEKRNGPFFDVLLQDIGV